MNPTELINKYGAEIASQLRVATEQLYDKLLWYTKISGIVDLITIVLVLIVEIIGFLVVKHLWDKNKDYSDPFVWVFYAFAAIIGGLVAWLVFNQITLTASKVFVPEFYLMHQIVEGLNNTRR